MSRRLNLALLALAVLIAAAPMVLNLPGEYAGTDDAARQSIENTGYRPWADPLWEPPSDQAESLIFTIQAALGAGLLGYVLGRLHGRRK